MLTQLLQFDSTFTFLLSRIFPHTFLFDQLFSFLSLQGLTIIVWLILLVIYLVFEERHDKRFIIFFLLSFVTTSIVVNLVIKNIVRRDRPYVVQRLEAPICPKDYSFPSGHAAGAFAGAVVFATFDKKRKWFYYGIASLIAYSRIYLTCHYFFDVIFGSGIGYSIGWLYLRAQSLSFPRRRESRKSNSGS